MGGPEDAGLVPLGSGRPPAELRLLTRLRIGIPVLPVEEAAELDWNAADGSLVALSSTRCAPVGGYVVDVPGPSRDERCDEWTRALSASGVPASGELVEAIDMPLPSGRRGAVHARRTRRRGHDLASVTLAVAIEQGGVARLSYRSVGPRPVVVTDDSGILADPSSSDDARRERLEAMFVDAAPSPTSMRASPAYRLAMLRVMGLRAVAAAHEQLAS